MNDLISRAAAFAVLAHNGQTRKFTNLPYISHPIAVAVTLAKAGMSDEVIAAGLLHDTIEDCGASYQDISEQCGSVVAFLVEEVTDISQPLDGNRAVRKAIDREHLSAASYAGKSIKLADLIDNTKSIVEHDPGFAKVYLAEKRELLSVLSDGHPVLFQEATRILIEGERKLEAA